MLFPLMCLLGLFVFAFSPFVIFAAVYVFELLQADYTSFDLTDDSLGSAA